MPLVKAKGQMYPWVTHMHTHLGGECPHKCTYCYVNNPRFGRPVRYQGPVRLIPEEFDVKYGVGKTIFIEHCNDILAEGVSDESVRCVINHCAEYPSNTYVFQSKNPVRFADFIWPENSIFGTTIETNRAILGISTAPAPAYRYLELKGLSVKRKFITVEPVLDFDVDTLAIWIADINPEFLNLGADSKNHNLPEPTVDKIHQLVAKLAEYGIELREKHNLARLKP
ncbi:conserved hypothetical protein [Gammaproteobacteria bacterium]